MVMLVIMIVGATTLLVGSLASSAMKDERDKTTENALTQAKEALIGYAVSDSNHPGNLPCPDVDGDGKLVMNVDYVGSNCVRPIGRLPWKTLGLPELRDGAGEHLWYAVSRPFAAIGTPHINSDTQGTLSISGTASASNVIAIVFAPGPAMDGTGRSPGINAACTTSGTPLAQSRCAANYLEGGNAASSTWTSPNLSYQSADASPAFNDRMIFITHQNLMPLVEKRIAREVKGCLDAYAAAPVNDYKYPWAAPVSSTTYTSIAGTLFGRPPASTSSYSSSDQLMLDDITALLNALDYYKASPSDPASRAAVDAAATKLYDDAASYVVGAPENLLDNDSINNTKLYAGRAQDTSKSNQSTLPLPGASTDTVSDWVGDEKSDIYKLLMKNHYNKDGLFLGTATPFSWPPSCTVFSSSYWSDWKNLVFYQIASGYAPGGSGSCASNITSTDDSNSAACIRITGTGNTAGNDGSYHAAVVVSGERLSGTRTATSITNYLEGAQAGRTDFPSSRIFNTYKIFDPNYPTVNDLVLCLDGTSNCQ